MEMENESDNVELYEFLGQTICIKKPLTCMLVVWCQNSHLDVPVIL